MNEEIEALYALLGVKPDEASVSDSVDKLVKAVQSKLKSSIYGGKDGVITLPATIEGKFKNGKEINQEIKDAYAAIYKKAQQMADESVSLTLNDIKDFKAQIDKFGKKTAKYKGSDIIANANNNLRQMLSDYQDFVNDLRKQVSVQQKTQIKQTQKAKAQQKAKTQQKGETAYDDYLNKQEKYSRQAQGAKERKELFQELDEVRENKSPVKSSGNIKASSTNDYLMRLSEYSAHGSRWANELARTLREEVAKSAKTLVTYIDPSYKKRTENGRATTEREFLNDTIKAAKKQLKNSIAQLEAGSEDITLDTLKEQAAVIKVLNKALGRTTEQAEKIITSAIENRYNGSTEVTQGKGKYKYDKTTQTKVGGTNLEEGQIKGAGPGHDNTQKLVKELYTTMHQWDAEVIADTIAKEIILGNEKTVKSIEKGRKKVTGSQTDKKITDIKLSDDYKTELQKLNSASDKTFAEVRKSTTATEKQANIDKIENVREAVSDSNVEKTDKENKDINRDTARAVKLDETTGFNTNSKSEELISLIRSILQQLQLITSSSKQKELPKQEEQEKTDTSDKIKEQDKTTKAERPDYSFEMKAVYSEIEDIFEPMKNALVPLKNSAKASVETPKAVSKSEFDKISRKLAEGEEEKVGVDKSNIYASPFRQGFWKKIEGAFESLTGATRQYEEVLRANAEDQDKLAAERIKTYGLNNGRNPNDTGDIAGMRRILQLYRTNKASIEQNPELMQKIQLTKGREVDTTEITKALNKALSGKRMEKAQNGGGFLKNAFGFMTGGLGYAVMPSIEKSRAQADGLNQVLGNINKALQSVLINIQTKETELSGMVESGQAEFDKNGYLKPGSSSAAFKTLADLEEEKLVLDSIKADLLANDEIIKKTGGRFPQMVKYLNFTSPVLKENNGILRNINSGLDKNGKALKFQNRLAEILNYTYQLMSRHIGQMIKNWITMANPINLIKKAFSDFGSYDVKWQRTMNVIKINFQRIIKPAMEWIAQQLVNIIGFFDIISQRIQAAFGQIPISLFDQAGAESEKIRRNLEEAANVSLGFDELHEVGTDQSGANNLMGNIYKPQLSQDWIDMATKLGDTLGGFFKGDLGFGDVCKVILELLGKLLGTIGKMIWNWFKETSLGKWITEHWKGLLATLLILFVGWQLLKIAGPTLFKALFGWISKSAIAPLFNKVGGWISEGLSFISGKLAGLFTGSGFLAQLGAGFNSVFNGGGLIGLVKDGALTFGSALGTIIGGALIAVVGGLIGDGIHDAARDSMESNNMYDIGLMENGGKESDKKGRGVLNTIGVIGGDALKFGSIGAGIGGMFGGPLGMLIGGGIGTAIGTIAGTIETVLSPSIDAATVSARNMNNELQKIDYYEGKVQGATTQVNIFDEQLNLLKQSLDLSTQSVYKQGEKLGISKTRMDELVKAVQDGKFTTDMLTGSEQGLAGSLTDLAQKQDHVTEVSKKLEEAQKKLLKAQTDLSIAQDVEAGNFEIAAARIEVAEAQGVYSTEDATAKRIQLYKQGGEEERKNLLQNLTPEQRKKMLEYNATTDKELKELNKLWNESSDEIKSIFTDSIDQDTINKFKQNLNSIDSVMAEHQGFWQGVGDTIAEIFSAGHAVTYTYNHEDAGYQEIANKLNSGKLSKDQVDDKTLTELRKRKLIAFAVGTNYVPNDGLAYLHQGEAVIPKKYNRPYQPNGISAEERAYMDKMIATMNRLDGTIAQGINVKGEFRQRGNDLVATVEKNKSRQSNTVLNNKVYAR